MIVRELVALLGIKTDKKGFDNASGGMNKLIGLAKTAAAAFAGLKAVTVLKGIVREIAETGDWLDKMSLRTGIATETLQRFGFAAELSGASLDEVENALKKLQVAQLDADAGLKTYKREFDRMGIDVRDAKGELVDTTDLLLQISDGMQGLDTDAERTSVAVKLLGRAGARLIPLLKDGSGALNEMLQEVEDLGALMDQTLIDQSAEYLDNQERLNAVWLSAKIIVGKQLLPVFLEMQESVIGWWKANRKWIGLKIGIAFKNLGRIIKNVGRAIVGIVRGVANWVKGLGKLPKTILKIGTALAVIAGLLEAGPLGKLLLIIGAVAAIIDDFMVWRDGGKSVIGDIIGWLEDLTGVPIEDQLREWTTSFDTFGSAMKSSFLDTVGAMKDSFLGMITAGKDSFMGFVTAIGTSFGNFISDTLGSFLSFITDITNSFIGFITGGKENIGSLFDKWLSVLGMIRVAFAEVFNYLVERWKLIGSIVGEVIDGILNRWSSIISTIKNSLTKLLKGPLGKVIEFVGKTTKVKPGRVAAPTSVVGRTPGTKIAAPQTNVSVNVKATPGMNEKTLASEVSRQVENAVARQNRAAIESLASS